MGFLNNIFGSQNKQNKSKSSSWKVLTNTEDLEIALAASRQKPIAIFKHSTRCSISSMAKSRLERNWNINEEDLDMYYLDLIAYRPVSNQIAETLEIVHESPQIIVVKNGKAVYHTSHNDISVGRIQEAIA